MARLGTRPPERVAVVRALRGLGDILCAVPALRALRASWPRAEISLIGLRSAEEVQQRFSGYLDSLIEFPGFPGVPEVEFDPGRLLEFLGSVQGRFDLALQMHGSGTHSNTFTRLLGAGTSAGCYLPALGCPDARTFLPYPAHRHEVHRLLALTKFMGVPSRGDHLEFPLGEQDRSEAAALFGGMELGRYVCLHPGAFEVERRWPVERFAAVGDALAADGFTVVLTGSAGERRLTAAVAGAMERDSLDLAGRTGLGSFAALLASASLVVCNDTGASHLTAAVRTPSVVIFAASDPQRWAPLDRERHRIVGHPMPERGNACRHTPDVRGHRCLRDACSGLRIESDESWRAATVAEVLSEARGLLAGKGAALRPGIPP